MIDHHWKNRERKGERGGYIYLSIFPEKETKECVSVTKCVCPWLVRNPQIR